MAPWIHWGHSRRMRALRTLRSRDRCLGVSPRTGCICSRRRHGPSQSRFDLHKGTVRRRSGLDEWSMRTIGILRVAVLAAVVVSYVALPVVVCSGAVALRRAPIAWIVCEGIIRIWRHSSWWVRLSPRGRRASVGHGGREMVVDKSWSLMDDAGEAVLSKS